MASPRIQFSNDFAGPLTQVGSDALSGSENAKSIVPGSSPYSSAGLTGYGEIVSVGESGLDDLSCFVTNGDGTLVKR